MKVARTLDKNYFKGGYVKFSTSRKDGELYYDIFKSNLDKSVSVRIVGGKVLDEAHLKELQEIEN